MAAFAEVSHPQVVEISHQRGRVKLGHHNRGDPTDVAPRCHCRIGDGGTHGTESVGKTLGCAHDLLEKVRDVQIAVVLVEAAVDCWSVHKTRLG